MKSLIRILIVFFFFTILFVLFWFLKNKKINNKELTLPYVSKTAELNQQIKDFLNYQGEYSKENIQKYLLPIENNYYKLGLAGNGGNTYCRIQMWLFDYIEKDGDLILLAGFDGKDDQRFVTALNIPLHFVNTKPNFGGVSFLKFKEWNYYTQEEIDGTSADLETIKNHLSRNNPMLFESITDFVSEEEAKKFGEIYQYYRNGFLYTSDLVSEVVDNEVELVNKPSSNGAKQIQKIKEISDVYNLNNTEMPVIDTIIYVGTK